jgi:glucosyl-3-phosphoglycerate synthase
MLHKYHYKKDFPPLESLIEQKKTSNTSISLVIPTLNEASTIGKIVEKARKELIEKANLLDEIIVLDGNSSDDTLKIAQKAGATVFSVKEIPPKINEPLGKGHALWKALFVTKGDIIIAIDADISNFQSHFIYGLIWPFFIDKNVVFSKSFYKRPLKINGNIFENYGGRVTEILVRPILSAFVPELAQIEQPLSGEYAFKRSAVENLSFSSGYGVEIGLIFDIYKLYGPSCIVQVDMETRCHRNRPTSELSSIAFSILQTILRKLEKENLININIPLNENLVVKKNNNFEYLYIKEVDLPSKKQLLLKTKEQSIL